MQTKKRSIRDIFYHAGPPDQDDISKYIRGDTWYDFTMPEMYICKVRKGCKKWCLA